MKLIMLVATFLLVGVAGRGELRMGEELTSGSVTAMVLVQRPAQVTESASETEAGSSNMYQILCKTVDSSTAAFRVSVKLRSRGNTFTRTQTVSGNASGNRDFTVATFACEQDTELLSLQIEELRTSAVSDFAVSQ